MTLECSLSSLCPRLAFLCALVTALYQASQLSDVTLCCTWLWAGFQALQLERSTAFRCAPRMVAVLLSRVTTDAQCAASLCLHREHFPQSCLSFLCAACQQRLQNVQQQLLSNEAILFRYTDCLYSLAQLFSCPGCVLSCVRVPTLQIDPWIKRAELRIQELAQRRSFVLAQAFSIVVQPRKLDVVVSTRLDPSCSGKLTSLRGSHWLSRKTLSDRRIQFLSP